MNDIHEAVRQQVDTYSRQLSMLRLQGTNTVLDIFDRDLNPIEPHLETPLSSDLHLAAGYIAFMNIDTGIDQRRIAVPFVEAKTNGGTTTASMHSTAWNIVTQFKDKHHVSVGMIDEHMLIIGTYSFRAHNGMLATIAKPWDKRKWLEEPSCIDAAAELSQRLPAVEFCMKIMPSRWLIGKCGLLQTVDC